MPGQGSAPVAAVAVTTELMSTDNPVSTCDKNSNMILARSVRRAEKDVPRRAVIGGSKVLRRLAKTKECMHRRKAPNKIDHLGS